MIIATTKEYLDYVLDHLPACGTVRYRKMFGEYMIYIDDKPLLTVCDNTVFVKKLSALAPLANGLSTGFPYEGAKEQYTLDLDDTARAAQIIIALKNLTPIPAKRKKA